MILTYLMEGYKNQQLPRPEWSTAVDPYGTTVYSNLPPDHRTAAALERIATAFERIASALEQKPSARRRKRA